MDTKTMKDTNLCTRNSISSKGVAERPHPVSPQELFWWCMAEEELDWQWMNFDMIMRWSWRGLGESMCVSSSMSRLVEKNERILSDRLYPNTLVNFAENCGGVRHFDFLFFRSTRTSTPVTCPWATWYFRWSTNRSRNRKICACCWGNSPVVEVFVTVLCLSSCLELPLHRWGCESPVSLLERTAKEPPFLAFPSEFLSAVSFRQLKWYLQACFYNSCVQILCCLLTKEVFLFIQCA